LVECNLTDAHGKTWRFIDKWPIFSATELNEQSSFPARGVIRCTVQSRGIDERGREVVEIYTGAPDGVEAEGGGYHFVVPGHLVRGWSAV
jgi:hypothetical protein